MVTQILLKAGLVWGLRTRNDKMDKRRKSLDTDNSAISTPPPYPLSPPQAYDFPLLQPNSSIPKPLSPDLPVADRLSPQLSLSPFQPPLPFAGTSFDDRLSMPFGGPPDPAGGSSNSSNPPPPLPPGSTWKCKLCSKQVQSELAFHKHLTSDHYRDKIARRVGYPFKCLSCSYQSPGKGFKLSL